MEENQKVFSTSNKNFALMMLVMSLYKLLQKFPEIIVAVSESRNFGIKKLINKNCDLIIMDDAYQHRSVNPGLNILVSSYNNLFMNDYLLPYGNLRESKK